MRSITGEGVCMSETRHILMSYSSDVFTFVRPILHYHAFLVGGGCYWIKSFSEIVTRNSWENRGKLWNDERKKKT